MELFPSSVRNCCNLFKVAAVTVIILGALVYAELGTVIPRSGSEYIYLKEAFGEMHPFWGPLPAFIYSFVVVIFVRPVEVVVIILTSAEYIVELIKDFVCIENSGDLEMAKKCIAFVQISKSVNESQLIANFFCLRCANLHQCE